MSVPSFPSESVEMDLSVKKNKFGSMSSPFFKRSSKRRKRKKKMMLMSCSGKISPTSILSADSGFGKQTEGVRPFSADDDVVVDADKKMKRREGSLDHGRDDDACRDDVSGQRGTTTKSPTPASHVHRHRLETDDFDANEALSSDGFPSTTEDDDDESRSSHLTPWVQHSTSSPSESELSMKKTAVTRMPRMRLGGSIASMDVDVVSHFKVKKNAPRSTLSTCTSQSPVSVAASVSAGRKKKDFDKTNQKKIEKNKKIRLFPSRKFSVTPLLCSSSSSLSSSSRHQRSSRTSWKKNRTSIASDSLSYGGFMSPDDVFGAENDFEVRRIRDRLRIAKSRQVEIRREVETVQRNLTEAEKDHVRLGLELHDLRKKLSDNSKRDAGIQSKDERQKPESLPLRVHIPKRRTSGVPMRRQSSTVHCDFALLVSPLKGRSNSLTPTALAGAHVVTPPASIHLLESRKKSESCVTKPRFRGGLKKKIDSIRSFRMRRMKCSLRTRRRLGGSLKKRCEELVEDSTAFLSCCAVQMPILIQKYRQVDEKREKAFAEMQLRCLAELKMV